VEYLVLFTVHMVGLGNVRVMATVGNLKLLF